MKRLTPDCRPPSDESFLLCVSVPKSGPEWFIAKAVYEDCFEGGKTLKAVKYWDPYSEGRINLSMIGDGKRTILGWAELPSTNFEE